MNNTDYTNYKNKCMGTQGVATGNSIDIDLNECEQLGEVKADIMLNTDINNECNVIRLWGQIKDCNGCAVPNALLKLLKVEKYKGKCEYKGVAHTVSDCEGFYQFDLCYCDGSENYKILVSRTNTGMDELVLLTGDGNCNVCNSNNPNTYQPCEPVNQTYKQGSSFNCNTQTNKECDDVFRYQPNVNHQNYKNTIKY
ncbi:MAG: hypothetical protein ACRDC3_11975 [Paraclostridium dentum]|uniref:hypothetical protein n=1 Tax=Paraclostridium TaxID=1849822 RepID=UPI0018FE7801|nr:hypothetical protein [Paraclostridium bifermentans]MDM8129768.1 hypothetical protein [Paraclostridium benzoelyticum]